MGKRSYWNFRTNQMAGREFIKGHEVYCHGKTFIFHVILTRQYDKGPLKPHKAI